MQEAKKLKCYKRLIYKQFVPSLRSADVSYTGSEIITVHKTKEQREHNKTLFPNPNQNNNGSFVLRHLSPVHESLPLRSLSLTVSELFAEMFHAPL